MFERFMESMTVRVTVYDPADAKEYVADAPEAEAPFPKSQE